MPSATRILPNAWRVGNGQITMSLSATTRVVAKDVRETNASKKSVPSLNVTSANAKRRCEAGSSMRVQTVIRATGAVRKTMLVMAKCFRSNLEKRFKKNRVLQFFLSTFELCELRELFGKRKHLFV